ncbi:MAG: hypothetical protein AAGC57_08370 [Pseudomonadota bacterium]
MGSPIDSWEGAGAYFTGAGGASPGILLLLAVIACFGAIAYGAMKEEQAHKDHEK